MCVRPVKVKNRSNDITKPFSLMVPCNHCIACLKSKADGFEYRSIKELEWARSHRGDGYFFTMTYDDAHLPHAISFPSFINSNIHYSDDYTEVYHTPATGIDIPDLHVRHKIRHHMRNGVKLFDILFNQSKYLGCKKGDNIIKWKYFSCHDKKDIQNFHKRLRINLKRAGYNVSVSYLTVCEYGSDDVYISDSGELRKGTIRPHYHGSYFLTPLTELDIIPSYEEFIKIAHQSWGKCDPSQFLIARIDNKVISACQYITKYIFKQSTFQEFERRALSSTRSFVFYDEKKGYIFQPCSRFKPFFLCSKDFGAKQFNLFSTAELISICSRKFTIVNQNGKHYSIPCPKYYIQKFLYQKDYLETRSHHYLEPIYTSDFKIVYKDKVKDIHCFESRPTELFRPVYECHKSKCIDDLYLRLCTHYKTYFSHNKPFSEDFLQYALRDFLLTRNCHYHYEYDVYFPDVPIDFYLVSLWYPDNTQEMYFKICDFIDKYRERANDATKSKLEIIEQKNKKRSAERKQQFKTFKRL